MKDIHGKAIWDYYTGQRDHQLLLFNSYGEPEDMPIDVFFREPPEYSDLENIAIGQCHGKILDIGAAAGTHALLLQTLEMNVSVIENSEGCCRTMKHSGVEKVYCESYQSHDGKYDTLLLLMNGIGIIAYSDSY